MKLRRKLLVITAGALLCSAQAFAAPTTDRYLAQATSDEPSQPTNDEPNAGTPTADEPEKAEGEPEASVQGDSSQQSGQSEGLKVSKETTYGVGVHVRGIFVPTWFLNLFVDASTPLNSVGFGGEFIRRKGNFDLIGSVDFGLYSAESGNWLGKGESPVSQTKYLEFRNFNVLAFNVHFIGHVPFAEWVSFVYGGGIGLGIITGKIKRVSTDPLLCTATNYQDINACYPKGMDPSRRAEWMNDPSNAGTQDEDTPQNPKVHNAKSVPPVVPIIHLLVGMNFKISDEFSVRVDGGFRDGFYAGATGHYFF